MKSKLQKISEEVRTLLKKRASNSLPYRPFNEFPRGCCSDSSQILSEIINRKLQLNSIVVSYDKGVSCHSDSHAWVELDGICIDITADQFCTGIKPVYVGEPTELHKKYLQGTKESTSQPDWLESVVEDLLVKIP